MCNWFQNSKNKTSESILLYNKQWKNNKPARHHCHVANQNWKAQCLVVSSRRCDGWARTGGPVTQETEVEKKKTTRLLLYKTEREGYKKRLFQDRRKRERESERERERDKEGLNREEERREGKSSCQQGETRRHHG